MSDSYVLTAAYYPAWAPLTAFTTSLLLVWWLATGRFSRIILDHPKSRSLHATPLPRTGGLGLHAGFLVSVGILHTGLPPALWIAFAAMFLISLLDDVRGVTPALRLAVHLGACGYFAHSALIVLGPVTMLVATLVCAWMANLYNFMDGSDGMAGGMAVAGFSFYGFAALQASHAQFAFVNFSVAASAFGFLIFNFHPARIFLGDVGSVPLGFMAAALGIEGWQMAAWSWWFPFLVFSPFVADASVTLGRRLFKLEKIWRAHRDHYYQRLVRMGWGHRKTTLAAYVAMLGSGVMALLGETLPLEMQLAILVSIAVFYLLLFLLIEHAWQRHHTMHSTDIS